MQNNDMAIERAKVKIDEHEMMEIERRLKHERMETTAVNLQR